MSGGGYDNGFKTSLPDRYLHTFVQDAVNSLTEILAVNISLDDNP